VDSGHPQTLYDQLERREEYAGGVTIGKGIDVCALFHGSPSQLTEGHRFLVGLHYAGGHTKAVQADVVLNDPSVSLRLYAELADGSAQQSVGNFMVQMEGGRLWRGHSGNERLKPTELVTSNVVTTQVLRDDFAVLGASRSKIRALNAMKLLDPRVEGFEFVPTLHGRPDTFEVLLEGEENGRGIGQFGEGFRRVMRLAFALGRSQNSVLLIDEIENGVHHSAMASIWTFIVKAAKELDVQVLVTTHSKDVLEAIASLQQHTPDLVNDITIHRLETGRSTSVRISPEGLLGALISEQEVR